MFVSTASMSEGAHVMRTVLPLPPYFSPTKSWTIEYSTNGRDFEVSSQRGVVVPCPLSHRSEKMASPVLFRHSVSWQVTSFCVQYTDGIARCGVPTPYVSNVPLRYCRPPILDCDEDSAWPPEEQSIPPAGEPHRRPADDGHQVFNAVQQDSVEQPLVPFL